MLKSALHKDKLEAGCDEAGRGCLAGPVVAAAVVLPHSYKNRWLNDSKQLSAKDRQLLRQEICEVATAYATGICSVREIEKLNILRASILAMHKAVKGLKITPEFLLIDGNRFYPYPNIPHACIVRGDATYLSIAAASVLAKTTRDQIMDGLHDKFPAYGWAENKGYPTAFHRNAIRDVGPCQHHRNTFRLLPGKTGFDLFTQKQ